MRLYYYTAKQWGIKSLWENRLKIALYKDLNDPFELYPFNRQHAGERKLWQAVVKELHAHGVLCFSESWQTTLMWAHYAEKHTGTVLGFEIDDSLAEEVKYIDERLPSPIKMEMGETWKDGSWLTADVLRAAVNTKFNGWAYERERRLRVALGNAVDGIYYKTFDEGLALREVVIGSRCSLSQSDVSDAIDDMPWYDVEITKARESFGHFEICRDERVKPLIVTGAGEKGRQQRQLVAALRHRSQRQASSKVGSGI